MSTTPETNLPFALTRRSLDLLRFLFDANLPVPTHTLARAFFSGTRGTQETQDKRAWRALDRLRRGGLVGRTVVPTVAGRPPSAWYLMTEGRALLQAYGYVREDEVARLPRHHKSHAVVLHRRRHDLHVLEVAAEVMALTRKYPVFALDTLAFDRSTWVMVETAAGELSVAPDLAAVFAVRDSRIALFIEVQGVASPLSAVEDKVRGYLAYLRGGQADEGYAATSYRVLFVTFCDAEDGGVDHCHNVLEAAGTVQGAERVVYGTTMKAIVQQGLGAVLWLRPADLHELLARLPEDRRERFRESRHAVNRVRAERDALIEKHCQRRRFYE